MTTTGRAPAPTTVRAVIEVRTSDPWEIPEIGAVAVKMTEADGKYYLHLEGRQAGGSLLWSSFIGTVSVRTE